MVCTLYDEYLQDKDETVWITELSDGTRVYSDDGRYGETDKAWLRLKSFLNQEGENRQIERIFIKFRSHIELVVERTKNTIGWFFSRAAEAYVGQPTYLFMIFGTVENKICKTVKWRIPEIHKGEEDERDPSNYEENIIWDRQ